MPEPVTLLFVTSSDPFSAPDAGLRKQIRKQAMSKAAAARKKRGNYGKSNLGQLPQAVIQGICDQADGSSPPGNTVKVREKQPPGICYPTEHAPVQADQLEKVIEEVVIRNTAIPRNAPSAGYERMVIEYDFHFMDLSSLTSFHMGHAAAVVLHSQPATLPHVLKCRQWSYCDFLPDLYGKKQYLDDAIHCVAARIREYLSGATTPSHQLVLSRYKAALQSLQLALNDPAQQLDAEVLCATEVLAIYEVCTLALSLLLFYSVARTC